MPHVFNTLHVPLIKNAAEVTVVIVAPAVTKPFNSSIHNNKNISSGRHRPPPCQHAAGGLRGLGRGRRGRRRLRPPRPSSPAVLLALVPRRKSREEERRPQPSPEVKGFGRVLGDHEQELQERLHLHRAGTFLRKIFFKRMGKMMMLHPKPSFRRAADRAVAIPS